MKKLLTLLLTTTALSVQSQSVELMSSLTFANLKNEQKTGYGTAEEPIPSGAFKYISNRPLLETQMRKLENSFRWPNGERISFAERFSTAGKSKASIVDCYTLVRPGTTDTIRLFVDPYTEAEAYYVPKGLIALDKATLAKEVAPYLKMAEELDAVPDAFILKESSAQLLQFISTNLNPAFFLDLDLLKPVLTDETADNELRGYLMRSYIFGKFIAAMKELPNSRQYAYDKMKLAFQKFQPLHPDVKTGAIADHLK